MPLTIKYFKLYLLNFENFFKMKSLSLFAIFLRIKNIKAIQRIPAIILFSKTKLTALWKI